MGDTIKVPDGSGGSADELDGMPTDLEVESIFELDEDADGVGVGVGVGVGSGTASPHRLHETGPNISIHSTSMVLQYSPILSLTANK